jgi:hypothetical protein
MKKIIFAAFALASLLSACGSQTPEDKVDRLVRQNIHALTSDERPLAQTNAKAFFEKEFPVQQKDGSLGRERGVFLECRPSDSNFNGLVTCKGMVPQMNGGFRETTRYCGYRPELVGCSDEDTVAK